MRFETVKRSLEPETRLQQGDQSARYSKGQENLRRTCGLSPEPTGGLCTHISSPSHSDAWGISVGFGLLVSGLLTVESEKVVLLSEI